MVHRVYSQCLLKNLKKKMQYSYRCLCAKQESYSSSSPIWFVDSDEPNLTSVLEHPEDTKNNHSVKREAKLFSLFLMNIIFRN
ncbi:putative ubiquitin-conjugating enzyme E2Q2-like protein [Nomascus leucogenys]|uniref:putative ubiquitin-conjugating enzyme E2Q2-like protein n=1 Tax=Nomascus leucogenys TaxID=61853 RepID=UPI00122D6107|nr:putative ubiquitin-conjugating enzyme E2Q2-like protein [Nomascus leucogenys]